MSELPVHLPEDVDAELVDAHLAIVDGDGTAEIESPQPWQIASLGAADWAMAKLAQAITARDEYQAQADQWAKLAKGFDAKIAFFTDRLAEYGLVRREELDQATTKLRAGMISTRKSKEKVQIDDKDAVLAWAKEHSPDAVKVTESVLVSRLTGVTIDELPEVDENGEIVGKRAAVVDYDGNEVPGCVVAPSTVTATVKTLGL